MFFHKADKLGIIIVCQGGAAMDIIERYLIAAQRFNECIENIIDVLSFNAWQLFAHLSDDVQTIPNDPSSQDLLKKCVAARKNASHVL